MAFYSSQQSSYLYLVLPLLLALLTCFEGGECTPSAVQVPKAVTASSPTTTESNSVMVNPRPVPTTDQDQCVPFQHYYCSKFGYNYTISPNPWVRGLTFEQAKTEFEDFTDLFKQNCSEQLGTFLCFTYFPLCYHQHDVQAKKLVVPCRETCEIVHQSECNDIILGGLGQWPGHLRCSKFHTKSETENGNCAEGDQQVWTAKPTDSGNGGTDATTPATEAVMIPSTTDEKKPVSNCEDNVKCKTTCSVREKSSARTFKTNDYTFAAKVVVSHKLTSESRCKHAYQVEVVQQFNLTSLTPALQSHSIIHTSPFNCDACPELVEGSTYLIAGQYRTNEDGTTEWQLPNGKSNSMVSKWKGKRGQVYDKKLQGWIMDANKERLQRKTP